MPASIMQQYTKPRNVPSHRVLQLTSPHTNRALTRPHVMALATWTFQGSRALYARFVPGPIRPDPDSLTPIGASTSSDTREHSRNTGARFSNRHGTSSSSPSTNAHCAARPPSQVSGLTERTLRATESSSAIRMNAPPGRWLPLVARQTAGRLPNREDESRSTASSLVRYNWPELPSKFGTMFP